MPLYARHVDEHYPDRNPSEHADDFVVLSGAYEVGGFHRIADGPSEDRWSWGAGLGAATANFAATGYATSPPSAHRPERSKGLVSLTPKLHRAIGLTRWSGYLSISD
jgi:hypothetical protein